MARPDRLHIALVCLALLPGLLFRGGESMRLCLHSWIDIEDGCSGSTACHTPPAEPTPAAASGGCCSEGKEAPEEHDEPEAPADKDCGGCCIEIHPEGAQLAALPPDAGVQALCQVPPAIRFPVFWPNAPARRPSLRPSPRVCRPPAHAPTPLRI